MSYVKRITDYISRKWKTLLMYYRTEGITGVTRGLKRAIFLSVTGGRRAILNMQKKRAAEDPKYHQWFLDMLPDEKERERQHGRTFSHTLSFLIPTYNTRPDLLEALADSLKRQTCDAWEACFLDGHSSREETKAVLQRLSQEDSLFHVEFSEENLGISGNTNKAFEMAKGDVIALCDHDDLLTEDAVYWLLDAFEHGTDLVYSDEDKTDEDGSRFFDPHLKADFSPDSLRSGNYICHCMAMTRKLYEEAGRLRSACDGSQDHDLALRASEKARVIAHIPRVLYHWRMVQTSFSHAAQERCAEAALRGVSDQLTRLKLGGTAHMELMNPKISWDLPEHASVSIHVRGTQDLDKWLKKLLKKTDRQDLKLVRDIQVEEGTQHAEEILGIPIRSGSPGGSLALFLDTGLLPEEKGWLHALVGFATRPWIGYAGGAVTDRRKFYFSCGYALGGSQMLIPRMHGEHSLGHTYQLYDRTPRDVTAVSRRCLMIRRELLEKTKGLEEYASDLGSAALGLRLMEKGLYNVTVPDACMRDISMKDAAGEKLDIPQTELRRFKEEFGDNPPEHFFSPHFERENGAMFVDTSVHRAAEAAYTDNRF